jgi:hypothetical protein
MPDLELELSSLLAAAADLEAELLRAADGEPSGDVGAGLRRHVLPGNTRTSPPPNSTGSQPRTGG